MAVRFTERNVPIDLCKAVNAKLDAFASRQ